MYYVIEETLISSFVHLQYCREHKPCSNRRVQYNGKLIKRDNYKEAYNIMYLILCCCSVVNTFKLQIL